mgnify:CR=1 FL=1
MSNETVVEQVQSRETGPAPAALSTQAILGIGVWTVLVACVASFVGWNANQQSMKAELALRPKIVVVDTFGWIRTAGAGATLDERYVDGSKRLKRVAAKLAKEGVLVIDKSSVRGAPADVTLQTPKADAEGDE